MSVANVEKTRCYETISEMYLYDACKAQTLLYCVCVVAAKLKHFCIAFASLPQSPYIFVLRLRRCCKAQTLLYCVCVVAAKLKHFCIAFASLPQSPNTFVLRLRRCRKAHTLLYCICVVAAILKQVLSLIFTKYDLPGCILSVAPSLGI